MGNFNFLFFPYSFKLNLLPQKATTPACHLYMACALGFSRDAREESIPNYFFLLLLHFLAPAKSKCCGFCSPHPAALV
jgi:hypothetical protein